MISKYPKATVVLRLTFAGRRRSSAATNTFSLETTPGVRSVETRSTLTGRRAALLLFTCLTMLLSLVNVTAQTAKSVQYTKDTPDQTLRSDLKVDPSTLGLSVQVPIAGYPGRAGASLPITLNYSSKQWRLQYDLSWTDIHNETYSETHPVYAEHSRSGWSSSLGVPYVEWTNYSEPFVGEGEAYCSGCPDQTTSALAYFNRIHLHMPDGSTHELRLNDNEASSPATTGVFVASDASHIKYDADTATVYMPDGSRYQLGGATADSYYIDRNGNTLTYHHATRKWSDALGRELELSLPDTPAAQDYTYTLPSVNGGTLSYTVRWKNLGDSSVFADSGMALNYLSSQCAGASTPAQTPHLFSNNLTTARNHVCSGPVLFNPVVLYQIVMPNGTSYTFNYNEWGEITRVSYPTGGYERYAYAKIEAVARMEEPYAQANRGVTDRWTSPRGDGTDEIHWHYASTGSLVTTTAPDGSHTERQIYKANPYATGLGFGLSDAKDGMSYEERAYSPGNTMLRRTLTEWATSGPTSGGYGSATRDARPVKEVSIILDTGGDALASVTTMTYDDDLNVIATSHYGFVTLNSTTAQTVAIGSVSSGSLLRTEEATFLVNDTNIAQATRDAYRARNLLSLPTSTRVKDASGTVVAQTQTSYDEMSSYPLLTYSGSMVEWTDPATSVRGLPTTSGVWLNTTSTYVPTHAQYDQFGNLRNSWDANGNESQVAYSSTYNYAYLSSTTSAVPDSSGAHGSTTALTSSAVYNAATGRVTSTVDANNQMTSYTYDSINRLSVITRPTGGGTTSFDYDDTPGSVNIRTRSSLDSTRVTDSYQYLDGLGRPVRTFVNEGSSSYLTTDTQYDTLGRVWRVSSPYRVSSLSATVNPDGNWTTNAYDYSGRVTSVTTPDSAVVSTAYSGPQVLVTDQAGKQRMSQTNALGQLKDVWEIKAADAATEAISFPGHPEVTAGYRTSYSYDTLDDLILVTQGAQPARTFAYDSLKRLTSATNPESGAICYGTVTSGQCQANGYDANGNLIYKTDARGILSTYVYDALNRNISVTYTNDSVGTPTVTRTYDGATNGKGKLWTTETAGATGARTTINSFDALGRPTSQSQQFYSGTAWSQPFPTQRTYNLAGGVTSQSYPSDNTVNYNYDLAGRLADKDTTNLAFSGKLGDGVTRTYSRGISYSPFGAMVQEQLGTDPALYNKLGYNSRGQLAEIKVSTTANDSSWNRGKFVNWYSLQCGSASSVDCNATNNNGNLRKQETFIPNTEANTSSTSWYQQYDYDSLNRLQRVHEYTGDTTKDWQQEYSYDRYGNRSINQAATTQGVGINSMQAAVVANTTTNRLYAPGETETNHPLIDYDNAGNQKKDYYSVSGVSYDRSYDGENRMTSSTATYTSPASTETSSYTYNGDGQRVRRKVNGVETWQVYGMDGELLAEYAAGAATSGPQKEYGYRNGQLLITTESSRTNFALAANGGTASGSSVLDPAFGSYPASRLIDGTRRVGSDPYSMWVDNTLFSFPDWVEISFNGSKSIDEIDVITRANDSDFQTEPTLTQTFSNYGMTAFDVQYWNGASWVTVTNGSVTGNNKVWRQFSFSAITTSKIRVVINDAADHALSRMAEIEAWGGTTQVQWLVTDQLGTPRLIFDQTGALATTKRHDYLPFGEELSSVVGLRSSVVGYAVGDTVRQKFTQKERDNETGLDYFGARYYASTQGRFTSSDPLLSSSSVYAPQSWNRYSYTINNPLKYTDQFGMYICNGTKDQCKDVESGLKKLEKARDSFKKGSNEYNRLDRSRNAYGAQGVDNGVTVAFAANKDGAPAATAIGIRDNNGDGMKDVTADNPTGQNTVVTIDTSQHGGAADYAGSLGHEGSHVADGADVVGALPVNLTDPAAAAVQSGPLNLTKYQTETRAYGVSAGVAQGLGYDSLTIGSKGGSQYEVWNSGWGQADRAAKQAAGIDRVLAEPKSKKGLYEVTPANQGKRLIE